MDVFSGDVLEWWMGEEDRIYLIIREGKDEGEYLLTAERRPKSEVPQKEIIRLGTNGNSEEIQRAVVSFNRSNEKYRVEITNYAGMLGSYSDSSDYQAVEERFLLDLTSGKSLDLVFTDLLSAYDISPDGLLENLTPYLERSNLLNAEDFFPEILQAATYHGDLTYLSNSFHITTLLCKTSLEGVNQGEWTVDSLIELAGKNPNAYLFQPLQGNNKIVGELNARNVIGNVLMINGGNLFGGETFDKKGFVKLLDKAKKAYDTGNQGILIREALDEKKLLFVNADIWEFHDLSRCFTEDFARKDMMAIGYPTEYGQGKSVMEPCKGIGILVSSEYKEAAWAFIEFYIPYSDETNRDRLSTRKSIFEEDLRRAYQYAEQDLEIDDMNYMEEKALELLEDMIENAVGSNQKTDPKILDIIHEEAMTFYSDRKTAEEVVDIVAKRVRLYSSE